MWIGLHYSLRVSKLSCYFVKNITSCYSCRCTIAALCFNKSLPIFSKDKDNGNLVFSVAFDGIFLNSSEADLMVSQRGKQPKIITERASGTYRKYLSAFKK